MKKFFAAILLSLLALSGCSYNYYKKFYKSVITVEDAMKIKNEIDDSPNPAKRQLLLRDLQKKMITVGPVVVKKVIQSTNVDYDFCVVVEVPYLNSFIDCYIYNRNNDNISTLSQGVTKISCLGDFGKFFSTVEGSYVSIEVLNSDIDIVK